MDTIKGTNRGGAPQVRIKLPVKILVGDDEDESVTEEIGFGGIFAHAEKPYVLRQLVQLSIQLPEGPSLSIRGMVVRVVDSDVADELNTVPGIAVQFYALEVSDAETWGTFVREQVKALQSGHKEQDASLSEHEHDSYQEDTIRDLEPPSGEGSDDGDEASLSVEEFARAAGLDPRIVMSAIAIVGDGDSDSSVEGLSRPIHIIGPDQSTLSGGPASESSKDSSIRKGRPTGPSVGAKPIDAMSDVKKTAYGYKVLDDVEERKGPVSTEKLESGPYSIGTSPSEPAPQDVDGSIESESSPPSSSSDDLDGRPTLPLTDSDRLRRGRPHRDPVRLRQRELPPSPMAPSVDDSNLPPPALEERDQTDPTESRPESAGPLAPTGSLPNVVYRLELPTVSALEEFSHVAFGSGGVAVRTPSIRPAGTPAIVCVVHPVSRHEFHIPGSIVATRSDRLGVSIRFARVTAKTFRDFRRFIAIGRQRQGRLGYQSSTSGELTMVSESSGSHESIPPGISPKDTHPVAPEAVEPLRKGWIRE